MAVCKALSSVLATRVSKAELAQDAIAQALDDPACVMVNRNQGSGTRVLIDRLLGGVKPRGYAVQPRNHNAVAAAVARPGRLGNDARHRSPVARASDSCPCRRSSTISSCHVSRALGRVWWRSRSCWSKPLREKRWRAWE